MARSFLTAGFRTTCWIRLSLRAAPRDLEREPGRHDHAQPGEKLVPGGAARPRRDDGRGREPAQARRDQRALPAGRETRVLPPENSLRVEAG